MRRIALATSLVLCFSHAPSAWQQPAFSSKVEAVRVDVLVTDKGQPIRGLSLGDFELLDNAVPQQLDLVSFEQIPLNLVLVLDMSSSVVGERLEHLRAGARSVLDGLKREDQAALVTFNHAVVRGAPLSGALDRVRDGLARPVIAGETSLVDAVYSGMLVGESDAGRALAIVFSDGLDTASWLTTDAVLDTARRSDVVVYGVTAGESPRRSFLHELTDLTGGTLLDAGSAENVGATFRKVLEEFRQRYLVSYSPRGVVRGGWHRLEVRVKRANATVKARPGYLAD